MRIMLFDASSQWSGGANRVILFSRELRLRGHDVTVCCLSGSEMSKRLDAEKIPFYTLNPRSDVNLLVVPEIVRMIRDNAIDIIDIHSPKFYWLALFAAMFTGKPAIITRNVPFRKTGVKKYINRFLYERLANRVIAISDKIKRELISDFDLDDAGIDVIYDGIEMAGFEVQTSEIRGRRNGTVTIGTISRLVHGKGLECLLEAIPEILCSIPDVRFVLAGSGATEQELKLQAKRLDIENKITFAGFVDDVPSLLGGMDVTIQPSPVEGMSMSALESMASGVPVVATSGGGLVDIIVNLETGVIVPPDDPKALAEGVIRLLRSDYHAAGLRARSVIEEKFALNHVVNQYENLLASLIHRADRHPLTPSPAIQDIPDHLTHHPYS